MADMIFFSKASNSSSMRIRGFFKLSLNNVNPCQQDRMMKNCALLFSFHFVFIFLIQSVFNDKSFPSCTGQRHLGFYLHPIGFCLIVNSVC